MFKRWSSELGRTEGDGEVTALAVGFRGVIAAMNCLAITLGDVGY